jgi:hypothetical protein
MITSTSSDRAEALHGVVNAAATVSAELDIPLDDVQLDVEGDLNVQGFFGQQDGVRWLASAMRRAE